MYLFVKDINSASFYGLSIRLLNFSDSVAFCVVNFNTNKIRSFIKKDQ